MEGMGTFACQRPSCEARRIKCRCGHKATSHRAPRRTTAGSSGVRAARSRDRSATVAHLATFRGLILAGDSCAAVPDGSLKRISEGLRVILRLLAAWTLTALPGNGC